MVDCVRGGGGILRRREEDEEEEEEGGGGKGRRGESQAGFRLLESSFLRVSFVCAHMSVSIHMSVSLLVWDCLCVSLLA